VKTYTALITAYGMVHQVDMALQTVSNMHAACVSPDVIAYASATSACARGGEREHTKRLLAEMLSACLEPQITHLTNVIVACSHSKDEAGAREALEDLKRRGFQPDAVAYTALITCLAGTRTEALAKAEVVLEEMRGACVEPEVPTYNAVLQVAMEAGARERFQQILQDMENRGLQRNRETSLLIRSIHSAAPGDAATAGDLAGSQAEHPPNHLSSAQPPLPAGWSAAVDPASGQEYYWCDHNPAGTTTWTRPLAATAVAAS